MSAAAPCRALFLLVIVLLSLPAAAKVPRFETGEIVEAVAVLEGGEIVLADGRHVAPLGIVLPRARQAEAETARQAMAARLIGRAVELRFDGSRVDRHGRVPAHLFIDGRWVEKELVRRGLARVFGTVIIASVLPSCCAVKPRRGVGAAASGAMRPMRCAAPRRPGSMPAASSWSRAR